MGNRMSEQSELTETGQGTLAHAGLAQGPALRLLVIDDDNLHRMIICRVAGRAGYLPVGAASYDEAAQLVQDNAFDCITLDLSLGEQAGVDMLRHLWVIGCKLPIIIISGCDDAVCDEAEKVAASLKLNVWESMAKPVNLAELRDCLERLKASRAEAALAAQPAA